MSIVSGDLIQFEATTLATSFSTANVGGGKGSTQLDGTFIGGLFFKMAPNDPPGGDLVQYGKIFLFNNNASLNLLTPQHAYITNLISASVSGSGETVAFVSSSASDDSTFNVEIVGLDGSLNAQTDNISLNGTTLVTSTSTWRYISRYVITVSGTLTALNGNLSCTKNSSANGTINAGLYSGTSEVAYGLEGSYGDTNTIADASTAPSGITFGSANTFSSGPTISGAFNAQTALGMWLRLTLKNGIASNPDVQVDVAFGGNTL